MNRIYWLLGWCQPVVIGANSTPTGTPNLGCGEKGNFIQCKTAQLCYSWAVKTAWREVALGPHWSALCWCAPRRHLQCFSSSQGNKVFSGKCTLSAARGDLTYIEGHPTMVPDWSILMQMRTPISHNLIGPKTSLKQNKTKQNTVFIGQNGASLVGEADGGWRGGYSCAAPIGWEKPQFYWLK